MKRLALVALFALPMAMTGCEKLNDATGPDLSNTGGPSAIRIKVIVEAGDSLVTDSTGIGPEIMGALPPPPPGPYDPIWP